jgi:E1A/CREB-binding protein
MRDRQHYIQSLQRRLMFLRHCARCQHDEALCPLFGEGCKVGKELWAHVTQCCDEACTVPRCGSSKAVLRHHQACKVSKALLLGEAVD